MARTNSSLLTRIAASFCKFTLALGAALGIVSAANAENYWWTGASGSDTNYSTPANWGSENGSSYPGTGDGAMFTGDSASKTVTFDGAYSPDWVWIATGDVLTPVTWVGATSTDGFAVAGNIGVADAGNQTGSLKAVSGTYTAGGLFKAGFGTGASAKVEFLGGNYTFNGATVESFWNGDGNPNAEFTFGAEIGTGIGFAVDIAIQNATVSFPNGDIGLGFWGTWQADYDSATANPDALAVGHVTVDINNGGVLSCGSSESPRELFLGGFGVEPITVNVNQGGTLKVGSIVRHFAGGASSVNLDGGTLEVLGTSTENFFPNNGVAFTVGSSGATLNTNGKEITIAAAVTGTGTLNVVGGGKVTFTVDPECSVVAASGTEVSYPSAEPSSNYTVYAWNDIFTADFEDADTYLSGWTRSTNMAANYDRRDRPGTDGQHYLAYYAYANGNVRGTTATYAIPFDVISQITSTGAYEIELDWFATVGYAGRSDDVLHSFFSAYSQDTVVAKIDALAVYSGGANGVDATVYKYGEVATEASVHTAPRGSDSYDASKAEYWYHVSLKATQSGVHLTVAKPDGTELVSNLLVSDYVVLTKLVFQVRSRFQNDKTVAGVDNIKINVPVFSTADGENYIVAAGSQYGSGEEETLDVSAQASVMAGKTIAKTGDGILVLTGLTAGSVCDINVQEGTLVIPRGSKVGNVVVSEGAHLLVDVAGAADGDVVFEYVSLSGDVACRNLPSVGSIEVDDTAKTWTYQAGAARVFTWIGDDGDAWNDASSWLVDGELTTDIPTAIDTVQFVESANISASGTLAGDVQIATGVTLTIPAGLTFTKLTAASGAKIAFSSGAITTVGGTLTLITVGEASGVAAALDLPTTYGVSVDSETGAITATRNAGTYTWTGAKDTNWATGGNWKVGDIVVADVPAAEDSVVFPASDAEGFEGWTVTLPWDVYAQTVTLNANVVLGGARTLKTHTINGTAELKLSNANIGCNGQDIVVNCPLNIMPETTDYIYLSGYNATLNGALYGSGKFISDANDVQYRGVKFNGNVSDFYGEFESTRYKQRDQTDMDAPAVGSENAVWRMNPNPGTGSAQQSNHFVIHDSETTYKFGAYVGGFWVGNIATPHIEIGKRDDVESSFSLTSYGSRSRFVFTKVGGGSMTITNGKGDGQIGTLYPNGGTSIIRTLPGTITFGGGALKTPIYDTVLGKTTKYVYANEGDAADERLLDEDVGESFTDGDVVYAFKETRQVDVVGPYYPDVSSVIKDSTGPIYFTDDGADYTWATALAESNRGGLIKDGAGTLTLSAEPLYLGPTWVKAGKIVFPNGTDVTLDPRSVGTAENADVQGYKYMDNTVLYGNEPGSDVTMNVDVSTITKVDISDPAFAEALVDDGYVVLCATTGNITGLVTRKFVMGETLLVPEKPEDVPAKKWNWMVRIMRVNGKNCLCVGPRILPYTITLR